MKRSAPLRRRSWLKPDPKKVLEWLRRRRRKPIGINKERRARLFAEDFGDKAYVEFIHSLPCMICGVAGWTEFAHSRSRGAHGKVDDGVPLCGNRLGTVGCHTLYDRYPWKLPEGTKLRLRTAAKVLRAGWLAAQPVVE